MPTKDTSKIKEKILSFLRLKGPSLPVHIAKEIGTDTLFASAFLSELISEKKVKISHMKVGSSSLHYLQGQESKLQNFSQHLNSKEREAFEMLKQEKFLKDSEVQPAIRVALRAIKDFAIPFKKNNETLWRFYTVPESEFKSPEKEEEEESAQKQEKEQEKKETEKTKELQQEKQDKKPGQNQESEAKKEGKSMEKEQEKEKPKQDKKPKSNSKPKKSKKRKSRKPSSKKNEKFFNKVKSFLQSRSVKITGIEGFSKKDLILKVSKEDKEYILMAFNKKRIREEDIIKAHKKTKEFNLPLLILSRGSPLKRTQRLIKAVKKLADIKKID